MDVCGFTPHYDRWSLCCCAPLREDVVALKSERASIVAQKQELEARYDELSALSSEVTKVRRVKNAFKVCASGLCTKCFVDGFGAHESRS